MPDSALVELAHEVQEVSRSAEHQRNGRFPLGNPEVLGRNGAGGD